MLVPCLKQRGVARSTNLIFWPLIAFLLVSIWLMKYAFLIESASNPDTELVREHIEYGRGEGGRWYIPASWQRRAMEANTSKHPLVTSLEPTNVIEAAELALELAIRNRAYISNSRIPLVSHQTWKNFNVSQWPEVVEESVEDWLAAASGQIDEMETEMAYVLWDDRGIEKLMQRFEPQLWDGFQRLPYNVEKADTFRVAVLRWFGGIYTDVDVRLLEHPVDWIHDSDLEDWTDWKTETTYSLQVPEAKRYSPPLGSPKTYQKLLSAYAPTTIDVGAIYGIEADTDEERSDYWRMGYSYPLQLTNWAFAMAPHHPTAARFLDQLSKEIGLNSTRLPKIDPLDLTGPPALTKAVKAHCADLAPDFRWEGLSGRKDARGGRGKVAAGDVLVLPITGFSPGRGRFHNMGSQPLTNPNARLFHAAAGSWRKIDLHVEMGKLCRTFFGGCRNWSKFGQG